MWRSRARRVRVWVRRRRAGSSLPVGRTWVGTDEPTSLPSSRKGLRAHHSRLTGRSGAPIMKTPNNDGLGDCLETSAHARKGQQRYPRRNAREHAGARGEHARGEHAGNTRGTRPAGDGFVERLEAPKAAGADVDKPATLANAKEWVPTHPHAGENTGTRGNLLVDSLSVVCTLRDGAD